MKIIGFSDVITNSSSEVFAIYTEEGLEEIKRIVNAILKVAESELTFDDLFEIKLSFDEDAAWEKYQDEYPEAERENVPDEVLRQFCIDYEEGRYEGYLLIDGFEVRAKDPKNAEAAAALASIDSIFIHEERYC